MVGSETGGSFSGGSDASPLASPLAAAAFYRDPAVRARILEFLGARCGLPPTARFVTTHLDTLFRPLLPDPGGLMWTALDLAPQAPSGAVVGARTAAAYRGLGMVLEWLGHEIIRAAAESSSSSSGKAASTGP